MRKHLWNGIACTAGPFLNAPVVTFKWTEVGAASGVSMYLLVSSGVLLVGNDVDCRLDILRLLQDGLSQHCNRSVATSDTLQSYIAKGDRGH